MGLFIKLLEWEENEDTYEEETDQIHSLLRILTISLGKDHCFFVQKLATFYNTYEPFSNLPNLRTCHTFQRDWKLVLSKRSFITLRKIKYRLENLQ